MTPGEPLSRSFNLFTSKADAGLYCAIRLDRPVPAFLDGGEWEYRGLVTDHASAPRDFRAAAAHEAASLNGYYLFTALRA